MARLAMMLIGGSSTGGVLGTVVSRMWLPEAPAGSFMVYLGAMLIGLALWSTLMFGRPWPSRVEE